MGTIVIKYQKSKDIKLKKKSFFWVRLYKSILYFIFKIFAVGKIITNIDYERYLYRIDYWYIEIEIGTRIPIREIGFDTLNRAILFGPSNRNHGFWIYSKTTFDINQYPIINSEIFNDIFEALEIHEIDHVRKKINNYFLKWTNNKLIETPQLPLLIYDPTNFNETFYCDSWDLLADVDLTGYEWDSSKRVIDANGTIYKTTYINFGHPIGCVYPEKIEETVSLGHFKEILRANFKKIRNKKLKGETFAELFIEII